MFFLCEHFLWDRYIPEYDYSDLMKWWQNKKKSQIDLSYNIGLKVFSNTWAYGIIYSCYNFLL